MQAHVQLTIQEVEHDILNLQTLLTGLRHFAGRAPTAPPPCLINTWLQPGEVAHAREKNRFNGFPKVTPQDQRPRSQDRQNPGEILKPSRSPDCVRHGGCRHKFGHHFALQENRLALESGAEGIPPHRQIPAPRGSGSRPFIGAPVSITGEFRSPSRSQRPANQTGQRLETTRPRP